MKQALIALALCALLAWAVWREPVPLVQHREVFALGTLLQLSVADPLPPPLLSKVQAELRAFEKRWSPQGDGELARLNALLASQPGAPLPEALRAGISAARDACLSSDGLFDPAMGALVQIWGFDDERNFRSEPPPASAIEQALSASPSLCAAELGDSIKLTGIGARLDFGASAKGRAVDEIIALLHRHGIRNAIVNAGGDLRAIGRRPDRAWRIGIRHPRGDGPRAVLASLDIADGEAVFSSGDYERYFLHEGRRYHHIIDPRDGYPATGSQSATVLHHSAELADAAATALFVAGPDRAADIMQRMGVGLWLLVDAEGGIHASAAMRERLEGLP